MNVTRKSFLATMATGTVAAVLRPAELLGATTAASAFKSAVGQTFRVQGGKSASVDLVLTKFVERPDAKTTQFSLTFDAPGGQSLDQGTYVITTKGLGATSIFIVPAGRSGGHAYYRADFNLLAPTTKR